MSEIWSKINLKLRQSKISLKFKIYKKS